MTPSVITSSDRSAVLDVVRPRHLPRMPSAEPRPLFVTGTIETEASGIARIICDLANAVRRRGNDVAVYTVACRGRRHTTVMLDEPACCLSPPGRWMGRLSFSPALARRLHEDVSGFDVVHCHSLWMLPNHYACAAARRHQTPVMFTMHGYLEPWALARSRWKKRIVAKLFQDRDLRGAACIHVNTEGEMHSVRRYGLTNPVAVIPNGVRIDDQPPSGDEFLKRHPELNGRRLCLFLSRLHEKKGLGHLVDAWAQAARALPDWQLVIAGPDDGYLDVLRGRIARLQLGSVTITGPLFGTEKRSAHQAAELFVLPSFSEGFSMAILEAMAAGLPVMITPGCHFPQVPERGAGIEVEPTVEATAEGLRRLCSQPPDALQAMGMAGRQLVREDYSWDTVAARLVQVYEWITGSNAPPAFVHFA